MKAAALLLVLAAAAAAFLPGLDNRFVSWDDDVYVTANPLVTRGFPGNGARIFTTFVSGNYQPLVVLSHAVEFRFFGAEPRAYHAVNLALHLLNAALVFHLLGALLGGGAAPATAGALLFAVHPMRVEPVAWVSGRKDLLAAAFFLGALAVFLRRPDRPGRTAGGWVLPLFLLALLSKATTVVLPVVLLLGDWARGRLDARALRGKAPLFALAGLFGAVAVAARASYQGVLREGGLGAGEALFLGAYRLLCHYPARLLLPGVEFAPLYPPLPPGPWPIVLGLAALAGVAALLWLLVARTLRSTRLVAFGALFALVTLLPSLSVEVLGFSADRFAYLPAFGVSCAASEGVRRLLERRGRRRAGRLALAGAAAAAALALTLASRQRCAVWRDSVSLWSAAVEAYGRAPVAARNLAWAHRYRGEALARRGEARAALPDLDRAVGLVPGDAEFLVARGRVRASAGDPGGAQADYGAALRLDPRHGGALIGRGILAAERGAAEEAAADFHRALEADPRSAEASLNLGVLHLNRGEEARALPFFARAAQIAPGNAAAHYGLARSLSALGDRRRAREELDQAVSLGYPDDPSLRADLAPGREGGP